MTSPKENGNLEFKGKSNKKIVRIIIVIALLIAAAFAAKTILENKTKQPADVQVQAAPKVILQKVEETNLAVQREYIGKVEAIQSVSLKPQVAGEVMKVNFKEGSMVRAGQVLFLIDSNQYRATVDLRRAELSKAEANLDRTAKYLKRVNAADKRSVSESDIELAESNFLQGQADVSQARAALKLAQIDLGHTRITAPISGRIGAANFTKGNYVSLSSGPIATIVQMNPIRVAFALPDRDYLNQLEAFRKSGKSVYKTTLKLSNGKAFPAEGERDFEDNEIDENTGTLLMRLRFHNSDGLLIPGAMVRINTKPVEQNLLVVIPQIAILADAKGDYVYTVGNDNVAQQRRVTLGAEVGTMREVREGLTAGENIIIQGVQSLRPGMKVQPIKTVQNATKSAAELAAQSEADFDNGSAGAISAEPAAKPAKEGN